MKPHWDPLFKCFLLMKSLNPDDTGVILLSSRAWIVSAYVIETKQRLVQKGVLLSLYGHKTVSYKSMCIFGHSVIYETFQEERKMVKHVLKINVWESMYQVCKKQQSRDFVAPFHRIERRPCLLSTDVKEIWKMELIRWQFVYFRYPMVASIIHWMKICTNFDYYGVLDLRKINLSYFFRA